MDNSLLGAALIVLVAGYVGWSLHYIGKLETECRWLRNQFALAQEVIREWKTEMEVDHDGE